MKLPNDCPSHGQYDATHESCPTCENEKEEYKKEYVAAGIARAVEKGLSAVTILTNGKVNEVLSPSELSLETLQDIVGGYIEVVARIEQPLDGKDFGDTAALIIGNEEARVHALPINMAGTIWLRSHGIMHILHGDLVVVGQKSDDCDFSDCPAQAIEEIPRLWQPPHFEIVTAKEESQ